MENFLRIGRTSNTLEAMHQPLNTSMLQSPMLEMSVRDIRSARVNRPARRSVPASRTSEKATSFWTRMFWKRPSWIAAPLLFCAAVCWICPGVVAAQTIINVPPSAAPESISGDTILNLDDGGEIGFEFQATDGAIVNIYGGAVGSYFRPMSGATVNISGGIVGQRFNPTGLGTLVNISGGEIQDSFGIGSVTFNMSGGQIGANGRFVSTEINFSGGYIGDRLNFVSGAMMNISGQDFVLNGTPVANLDSMGDSVQIDVPENFVLSGTLQNGDPFAFSSSALDAFADGTVTLIRSADVTPGPSLIQVPTDAAPRGLRAGQTLELTDGGQLEDKFHALTGSTLNISGGHGGTNFETTGAVVNLSGGAIGTFADIFFDTVINMTGGTVGDFSRSGFGATINIRGGAMGEFFRTEAGSQVNISGTDFELNGTPVTDLNLEGENVQLDPGTDFTLTGTLEDGTPFMFSSFENDAFADGSLTLTRSADVAPGPALVVVPTDPAPHGLRSGQTLMLDDGGALAENFTAASGSTVNIAGGSVGRGFDALDGSTVNITGGSVGEAFDAWHNSTVHISGGSVGDLFEALGGSEVHISGGSVGDDFTALENSNVHISGGAVGDYFEARDGAVVEISGGSVGTRFNTRGGSTLIVTGGEVEGVFEAYDSSIIHISGGNIGSNFRAFHGSEMNISGGSFGAFIEVYDDAVMNISGGSIQQRMSAFRGGTINFSGGEVGIYARADADSLVNISGGSIGNEFTAMADSTINIHGGTLGDQFIAEAGAEVTVYGSDFVLNGVAIDALDSVGASRTVEVPSDFILTGTLEDGTPFAYLSEDADSFGAGTLTLTRAEVAAPGPAMIHVPSDSVPLGIRSGQTLMLADSGSIRNHFNAGAGSTVEITGGVVGENFEAVGATVNISGGVVGDRFDAIAGTTVNISGGSVGDGLAAFEGSVINLTDATIGDGFSLYSGSVFNMDGGAIGSDFFAGEGTIVNLLGGEIGPKFSIGIGAEANVYGGEFLGQFWAYPDSTVNFFGTDFLLDGLEIGGLDNQGDSIVLESRGGAVLSGVLADGTPFSFTLDEFFPGPDLFSPFGTLTLTHATQVPEPSTLVLGVLGLVGLVLLARRTRRS